MLVSEKLVAYAFVAWVGLFGALVAHRGAVALFAAPFVIALVAGLAGARQPAVSVVASIEPARAVVGDEVTVRFDVETRGAAGCLLEVATAAAPVLHGDDGSTAVLAVPGDGCHRLELALAARRWGTFELGAVAWRLQDPARLLRYEEAVASDLALQVHPPPELVRRLVEPDRTTPFGGSHPARRPSDGIEFAEIRPFAPGDRLAQVNGRVSARRGAPYVTARHPERHANVVVLLDTSSPTALEESVRGAVALVTAYAKARDRVGIVAFGSRVAWVAPGLGPRHLYRLLDALLLNEAPFAHVWRDLQAVPARVLPPNALVWLVSGLEDDRPALVAAGLRGRGFDVSVLEVELEAGVLPGQGRADALAHRLWRLRRVARRRALGAAGVPVAAWRSGRPVSLALAEAQAFRSRRGPRAGRG